jgi:hypothetical protein
VGGKPLNRVNISSRQKAAVYLPIAGLTDLFVFNKRCRILNVDAKKCLKKLNCHRFDQVMTYLAKYDFVILAEV